jgi:hypothetical protein
MISWLKHSALLALGLLLGSGGAFAATGTFTITVTLRQAISIARTSNLTFGTIELTGAPATYTVAAAATGHVAGTGATPAQFSVTGESGAPATASVNSPITIQSGANSLTVAPTLSNSSFTFGSAAQTIFVGASMSVPGATAPGTYAGTGTLTVLYQ